MKHIKINGKWIYICGNCKSQFTTKRIAKDHFITCQFLRALDAMEIRQVVLPVARMMPVAVEAAIELPAVIVEIMPVAVDDVAIKVPAEVNVIDHVGEGVNDV
ncbi:hypothetical protein Tco_0303853 [Tanacetum coccineum]